MSKDSRKGGKFSGNHTTLIPAAAIAADIASNCETVTRISPGFLKLRLKSVSGQRRVKITNNGASLLLSVRDNTSHQEVHVYATDIETAKRDIAEGIRNAGISVSFGGT